MRHASLLSLPVIHRRYRARLFWIGLLLSPLLLFALAAPLLASVQSRLPVAIFLTFHTVAELLAVVVAFLIFAAGLSAWRRGASVGALVLACAFSGVGILDLSHTLSFEGLPFLGPYNSPEVSIGFWLAARVLAALGILVAVLVAYSPSDHAAAKWSLPLVLLYVLIVHWLVLVKADWLPATYAPDTGLTMFKIAVEVMVMATNVITALLVLRLMRRPGNTAYLPFLFAALMVMTLSGVWFTLYQDVTDIYMVIGHVYKAIAYLLLYRAVFVESVDMPYQRLLRSERRLRRLVARQRLAAVAFDTQVAIMVTDANQRILRVNPTFTEITGYGPAEVLGKTPRILSSGLQSPGFYRELWATLDCHGRWEGEIWNRRKNGEAYPEHLVISAVRNTQGDVEYYVANFGDLTHVKQAEERIHALAYFDPLTQLPNRRMLNDHIRKAQSEAANRGGYWALLLVDLDNFKSLNDTRGHTAGDQLLQRAAERLRGCTRDSDLVARTGGDEFALLLNGLSSDARTAARAAQDVASKLETTLSAPYFIEAQSHTVSASIGIALFSADRESPDDLLGRAEIAMYRAKEEGGAAWRFFDPDMQSVAIERSRLEADMRQALERGQFMLYYQPKVDTQARIVGCEALIRWQHPQRGLVSPAAFVPVAESSGLIIDIGYWVIEQACDQLLEWARSPTRAHWSVAVNISERQLSRKQFPVDVKQILLAKGLRGNLEGRLVFEITESMLLEDIDASVAAIRALSALGIEFAMDDFGTGYSSLSYLKMLPLHQVKVDQSFVRDMLDDHGDAAIVEMVIALARTLKLKVVAEGVESTAQHDALVALGCDYLQGYLYGKPVPEEALPDMDNGDGRRQQLSVSHQAGY